MTKNVKAEDSSAIVESGSIKRIILEANMMHHFFGRNSLLFSLIFFSVITNLVSIPNLFAQAKSLDENCFEVDSTTQTITAFTCKLGTQDHQIVIPSTVNGIAIKHIGTKVFDTIDPFNTGEDFLWVDTLVISEGIESVEKEAFYPLLGITFKKVVLPKSLLTIGESAFQSNDIEVVEFNEGLTIIGPEAFKHNKLTSLKLPTSLEEIGAHAFYINELTGTLLIPPMVKRIDMRAFRENKITELVLSEGLQELGIQVFMGNKIKTLKLPNSLQYIGPACFKGNKINSLELGSGLSNIDNSAFANNLITDLIIPDSNSLTRIGSSAFLNNLLTSVKLPETLDTLELAAFMSNKIRDLVLSPNITTISWLAFANNQIENLVLPEGIVSIQSEAFANNLIKKIKLPESLKEMGLDHNGDYVLSPFVGNDVESICLNSHFKSFSFEQLSKVFTGVEMTVDKLICSDY